MRVTTFWRSPRLFGMFFLVSLSGLAPAAAAKEVSLGPPVTASEAALIITASSEAPLPAEGTDPTGQPLILSPGKADLFLAVDVRASKGNKNGFGAGEFVPYLSISYVLKRQGGGQIQQGQPIPLSRATG